MTITGATLNAPTGTSYPFTGSVTTTVQDGSGSGFYMGPSIKIYVVDPATTTSIVISSTNFIAGSAPLTVTAKVLGASNTAEAGLPVTFTSSSGGSFSPSSGVTNSSGMLKTTYTPPNTIGTPSDTVTATVGVQGSSPPSWSTAQVSVNTYAAQPTVVSFASPLASGTDYVTDHALPSGVTTGNQYARIAANTITAVLKDSFGNTINLQTISGSGASCTFSAATGFFDATGGVHPTSVSNGAGATCSFGTNTNNLIITYAYFQSGNYGTLGLISGSASGSYVPYTGATSISFAATGQSANIVTSTFDTSGNTITLSSAGPINAGSSVTLSYQLTNSQANVPVTFTAVNTTSPYTGAYFAGSSSSSPMTITVVTGSTGLATAKFYVSTNALSSTNAQSAVHFTGSVAAPTNTNNANTLTATPTSNVLTQPGSPSKLVVKVAFDAAFSYPTTQVVNGTSVYVNIVLADTYGNSVAVSNAPNNQMQIALTLNPPSPQGGLLTATQVYIQNGKVDTLSSFGAIQWTMPPAIGVAITLSASGVINGQQVVGSATVTTVSSTPSLSITKPSKTTVYSKTSGVVFQGKAAISAGYNPAGTVKIFGVFYKVGAGNWIATSTPTGQASVSFSQALFLSSGSNSVQFKANDTGGATLMSAVYTVLVDTAAPKITSLTAANSVVSPSAGVSFRVVDTLGDLNTTVGKTATSLGVVATYNSTSGTAVLPSVTVTPTTATIGYNTTYTVAVTGIPSGHWQITLSASDLAGNSASASVIVLVAVPIGQTFTAPTNAPPYVVTVSGFKGVNATFTSNAASTLNAQVWYELLNSANQVVQGPTFVQTSFTPGSTRSFFFALAPGLSSGTYTAKVFVVVNGNAYSQSYTVTLSV